MMTSYKLLFFIMVLNNSVTIGHLRSVLLTKRMRSSIALNLIEMKIMLVYKNLLLFQCNMSKKLAQIRVGKDMISIAIFIVL